MRGPGVVDHGMVDGTAAAAAVVTTHHSPPQQNYREGILTVYYQLLLKPIYTMTKRVLLLDLMDVKLCVAANGQRLGAALGILATLS